MSKNYFVGKVLSKSGLTILVYGHVKGVLFAIDLILNEYLRLTIADLETFEVN